MAAAVKRQTPPTHPTVWVGLGLAAVGLVVAAYAYTGTRIYDITFAFVAIVGGLLALAGILTAAWGRAIMSARAQRSRRAARTSDAPTPAEGARVEAPPPTVAAPASKRAFDFSRAARRLLPRPAKEKADPKALFAFRTPAAPPAPEPAPAEPLLAAVPPTTAPPEVPPVPATPAAVPQRVTVRCPQCKHKFSCEGVRPFTLRCPECGFAADV